MFDNHGARSIPTVCLLARRLSVHLLTEVDSTATVGERSGVRLCYFFVAVLLCPGPL
jgi:hypothetical protein